MVDFHSLWQEIIHLTQSDYTIGPPYINHTLQESQGKGNVKSINTGSEAPVGVCVTLTHKEQTPFLSVRFLSLRGIYPIYVSQHYHLPLTWKYPQQLALNKHPA